MTMKTLLSRRRPRKKTIPLSPQALQKGGIVFGAAHEATNETSQGVLTDREICCHGAGGIDAACDRLMREFGSELVDDALLGRIERLTGAPAHPFLKCGLFCAHRSMHELLDAYEQGEQFYLYTGRGPSADMHLGHLVPFLFTAYLQRAFQVPCIIQLTDDEKFLYKGLSFEDCQSFLEANVRDIIACGFNRSQTYIFSNFHEMGYLYPFVCDVQRHLTCNQVRATFGIDGSDSPAKMAFPAIQMVPALGSTFARSLFSGKRLRCLIPCGIDQDPYFRLTRDLAHRMGEFKPAVLQSKFLPSLAGTHTKMSSSGTTTILLSDSPKMVRKKINKAFSGGKCLEDQRMFGADLSVDVPLRYLHCFSGLVDTDGAKRFTELLKLLLGEFSDCTAEVYLEEVDRKYAKGELLSGEVKQLCAEVVSAILRQHLLVRETVSDEEVAFFMTRRQLL